MKKQYFLTSTNVYINILKTDMVFTDWILTKMNEE